MVPEVGIEALNVYCGQACIDVRTIFEARGLDLARFDNLMMEQKSVGLPCEDAVTHAVNAAKPLLDALDEEQRGRVEMVITATESGFDFAKSASTYIHQHLGLGRGCRLFEVKQACYAGTAALQMAAGFVASGASPGAKALVIASDVITPIIASRLSPEERKKFAYAEPSGGVAGAAFLVSAVPEILSLDFGANGYYSYEIGDVCRPAPFVETGDFDLSLLSYLDCVEGSFRAYAERVEGADFQRTFDYLAFHTPFAGMVKGAHRKAMRTFKRAKLDVIEEDFERRLRPALRHCVRVGGVYSATVFLALASLLEHAEIEEAKRVGIFSYGSGCSSEFYSGVVTPEAQKKVRALGIGRALDARYRLSIDEYDRLTELCAEWGFGVNDQRVDPSQFGAIYERQLAGKRRLVLERVEGYRRHYAWS